ncbi:MAG: hypothetical protein IJ146_00385 [Kiritimatiellae bacterium]|nr:hypothetical protein [Kiritimatiellia bacterium]
MEINRFLQFAAIQSAPQLSNIPRVVESSDFHQIVKAYGYIPQSYALLVNPVLFALWKFRMKNGESPDGGESSVSFSAFSYLALLTSDLSASLASIA